jgi:hypothetical protein
MLGIDRNPRKAGYAAKIGGNGWDLTLTREEYGEFISVSPASPSQPSVAVIIPVV